MKIIHVHNVAFVATTLVDALNKTTDIEAIFFERERYSLGFRVHFKNMILFRKLIKKENPDIVHIHYLPTSLYALFARADYILHVHGSDVRGMSGNIKSHKIKNILLKKFKIYALKKAQLIFYSTPDLKNDIEKIRKDSIFIPNPVKNSEIVKKDYLLKKDKVNILFFASLLSEKGADIAFVVLKILAGIYKERINIVCINFGKDKEKYNKYEFVNYINKIDHTEINRFIIQFDIIIGQLKAGAIGVSELEVMMHKIPLISNFKFNDFYPEKCPLISCDNAEDIVKAVQRLIENQELREELSEQQFQWVKKYHSDENIALKLVDIYKTI